MGSCKVSLKCLIANGCLLKQVNLLMLQYCLIQDAFRNLSNVLMWRAVSESMVQLLSSWANESEIPNQAFPRAFGIRLLQTSTHSSGLKTNCSGSARRRSNAVNSAIACIYLSSSRLWFIKSFAASTNFVWWVPELNGPRVQLHSRVPFKSHCLRPASSILLR